MKLIVTFVEIYCRAFVLHYMNLIKVYKSTHHRSEELAENITVPAGL